MYKVPVEIARDARIADNKKRLEALGVVEAANALAALRPFKPVVKKRLHSAQPRQALPGSSRVLRPRHALPMPSSSRDSDFSMSDDGEDNTSVQQKPSGKSVAGRTGADDLRDLLGKAIPDMTTEDKDERVQLLLVKKITSTMLSASYASVLTLEALVQQGVAFGHAARLVKWMAQGTVLGKRAGENCESASLSRTA